MLDFRFTVSHEGVHKFDMHQPQMDQMTDKPLVRLLYRRPGGRPRGMPISGRSWRRAAPSPGPSGRGSTSRVFVEVETGILQVRRQRDPFACAAHGASPRRWQPRDALLATSPEFACKKLLAAGETRIFELARVFRDRERGDLHLPEFTMLEWYRANAGYDAVMADSIVVIAHAAQAPVSGNFRFAQKRRSLCRAGIADGRGRLRALCRHRPACVDRGWRRRSRAARGGRRASVRISDDDTWSDIFSKILVEHVEPNLGQGRLTVLFEYPVVEAALARAKPSDPRVAERFEIYACGVELANGFGELTDRANSAAASRRRWTKSSAATANVTRR